MIFDYNLKKKKIKSKETILDEERFMYRKEIRPRTDSVSGDEETTASRESIQVNYLRKPIPDQGILALVTALFGFAFMTASLILMFLAQGKESMLIAVFAVCSILWSFAGIWFGFRCLFEKEKNYTISIVAISVCALQLIFWIILMMVGR